MAQDPSAGEDASVSHWETVSIEPHADARVFRVVRKHCRHPQRDVTTDFFVIDSVDWVNVIALTTDGQLVLVNQYRIGRERISLELPGGMMEPGEDPVAAGLRELQEETGFHGGTARLLATVDPNPAVQNNVCHFVFVDGVTRTGTLAWDEHEEIEVVTHPVDEVFAIAQAGGIKHSLTLNALFFFAPEWRRRGRV